MVRSELGINNMDACALYLQFSLLQIVYRCVGYFLGIIWTPWKYYIEMVPFNRRNLWQNQVQAGEAIYCDHLGIMGG